MEEEDSFTNYIWFTCKLCRQSFSKRDQVVVHLKDHASQTKPSPYFFNQVRPNALTRMGQPRGNELESQMWNNKRRDNNNGALIGSQPSTYVGGGDSSHFGGGGNSALSMSMGRFHGQQQQHTTNSISSILEQPYTTTSKATATTTSTNGQLFDDKQQQQQNFLYHSMMVQEEYVFCSKCNQNVFGSNVDSHEMTCTHQQQQQLQQQQKDTYLPPPPPLLELKPKLKERKVRVQQTPIEGSPRPPLTYACLSALALKNSNGRLPTNSIYDFICHHFPYYREFTNGHWRNSLRHSLATNPAFVWFNHQENNDNKGQFWKRGYWAISTEPMKALKMEEKLRQVIQKNRGAILITMADPTSLELLENGELKDVVPPQAEQVLNDQVKDEKEVEELNEPPLSEVEKTETSDKQAQS